MRLALLFLLCATPALAWEFRPDPICTISDDAAEVSVRVTYDPVARDYAIHLTRPGGWPAAAVFALRFVGPNGLTISTDRHQIEGDTLSVYDRGFGNVLNGLQFNHTAIALIGDVAQEIDLLGAADPVAAFRNCPASPSV
ncbi:MAG: excinuclease ABC subunit B [Paracoccaceae bacterium]|nr:excinuclease ABC subunit B [Paracoccaceae bacterium]